MTHAKHPAMAYRLALLDLIHSTERLLADAVHTAHTDQATANIARARALLSRNPSES